MIIGNTISFAGNPSINAISITPSRPSILAKGFKKSEQRKSRLIPPIFIFAIIHIKSPAGAATEIALPSTKTVLSMTDLMSILPNCGFLYGGSSSINEDGTPLRIVNDNNLETKNVVSIPRTIVHVNISADNIKLTFGVNVFIKNIDMIAINSGKAQFINCNFLIRFLELCYPRI